MLLLKFKLTIPTIFLIIVGTITYASDINVMPYPKEVKLNTGKFRLDTNFTVSVKNQDEIFFSAASRFIGRLDSRTGLFLNQDCISSKDETVDSKMEIKFNESVNVELNINESYKLVITESKVSLSAETTIGALYGIETLLQLVMIDKEGYYFPTIEIFDEPRFPWRGLLIDVGRQFLPIDVLKRNIDGMLSAKMNVLHLHLSEDQGFRIESKVYPKLHELGSDGLYYTQAEIKEIVRYASERGIRVIPEFDIPGHATSWFVGYPELASAQGPYTIERNWGVKDPTMDPTKEKTYEFLENLFTEITPLFPDPYFHIGGDENNGKQWDKNESIQEFMKENDIADNHELQAYFNKRVLEILTKLNKKMIGWDEILVPGIPKTIMIQSWRGHESLVQSAREGYKGILSNGYYIDLVQPASFHYLNDPIPVDSPLSDEEKKNILGGEATSWGELVTYETVDSRIWPRTAAIAERLWSDQSVNDIDDMYERIDRFSFQLEEHGLLHIKNYEMMLRRLTNNQSIDELKILVDVIEPVKIYQRLYQGVKYTQYSPYTRIVDAARPESERARKFNKCVAKYLNSKDTTKENKIKKWLTTWKDNHEKLIPIISNSPIIREIESHSQNLSDISQVGLEAIVLLKQEETAPVKWLDKASALIENAKKPYGQTEIHVIDGIEKLVEAVK
ncbi:MAG: family 20 glycosylhydrolase [Bacteroidota bacterium]